MSQPIDTASVEIVPDFSGFARTVKTELDAALRGVTTSVQDAFGRIERLAADAGRELGQDFQRGGERAEGALQEVASQARTSMAQVAAASDGAAASLGGRLSGALGLVKVGLIGAGVAAGAGLAALAGFGLKSAAGIEQTTIGLQALTGSAETAKNFLAELQTFAAATPFEFEGVADASRRILAFGQSVGITRQEVIPTLTTIGDLVSVLGGTQESVDSVVRALSQMASKGKLSQEEIMQLAEALPGFNANAAIASQLGLSVGDTLALISAGGVDAKTGIDALLAGMAKFPGAAGAMALQAQTLTGVFSTFKDTVSIALSNAFAPVIPEIKASLSELTPVIGSAIGQLAPSLGHALSAILPILGKLLSAIVPILTPILDALGPVLDALGPALQPLGEAIGQVLVALAPVLPILAQFIAVLAQLAVPILLLLAQVLLPLTPILNFMAEAIGEVARALGMIDWAAVGAAIGAFVTDAWNKTFEMFSKIKTAVVEFKDNFVQGFELVRQAVIDRISQVVAYVQALPGRLVDAAGDALSTLVQTGKNMIIGLWNGISSLGGWLWNKVTSFLSENTIGAAKKILGIASPSTVFADEVGRQIPAGIAEGVRSGMGDLQSLLAPVVPSAGAGSGGMLAGAGGLGGITINIVIQGGATAEDAQRIGAAAGQGVSAALARRSIGLAVRSGTNVGAGG